MVNLLINSIFICWVHLLNKYHHLNFQTFLVFLYDKTTLLYSVWKPPQDHTTLVGIAEWFIIVGRHLYHFLLEMDYLSKVEFFHVTPALLEQLIVLKVVGIRFPVVCTKIGSIILSKQQGLALWLNHIWMDQQSSCGFEKLLSSHHSPVAAKNLNFSSCCALYCITNTQPKYIRRAYFII